MHIGPITTTPIVWNEETTNEAWARLSDEAKAAYIQAAASMPQTTRPLGTQKPGADIARVVRKAKQLFKAANA
jgi:Tfp pilus assembly protein PilX